MKLNIDTLNTIGDDVHNESSPIDEIKKNQKVQIIKGLNKINEGGQFHGE